MMSDFENMDFVLGNDNVNTIERELSNVIGSSGNHCDAESDLQPRESDSHENGFGHFVHENTIPRQDRFQETMETFTSEINMRLSQELHMSMMYGQINRAINTAIAERVIPEIQNMVSSMSSSGNRVTEASLSHLSQEDAERNSGFKTKIAKKDSKYACDLRVPRDSSPYTAKRTFQCEMFSNRNARGLKVQLSRKRMKAGTVHKTLRNLKKTYVMGGKIAKRRPLGNKTFLQGRLTLEKGCKRMGLAFMFSKKSKGTH